MDLLFIIILIISIFVAFSFILHEYNAGKYNVNNGILEESSLENYKKDYPNKDVDDLKVEIEKIADRLIDNLESNRYTDKVREKAKNDKRIKLLKNEIADDVKIINYKDKKLKAKVNYILDNNEYSLIFDMITVNRGRVFLKKYNLMKQRAEKKYNFLKT